MENTKRQNLALVKKRKSTFSQKETFTLVEQAKEDNEVSVKFTKVQEAMLYNLERRLGVVAYAAKDTGITRQAHYFWMEHNPEYKKLVDALNDLLLDYAETRLLAFIKRNDFRAIAYILQTKGKNRGYSRYWREKADNKEHPKFVVNLPNAKDLELIEMMERSAEKNSENGDKSVK